MSDYQYSFMFRSKGHAKRYAIENYTGETFSVVEDNGPCRNETDVVPYDNMGCLCIHHHDWSINDAIPVATYEDVDFSLCDEELLNEAIGMILERYNDFNNVAVGGIRRLIALIDSGGCR